MDAATAERVVAYAEKNASRDTDRQTFQAMEALDGVELAAPVHVGQVVVENVCGTGADFVACRDLDALGAE